MKIYTRTGDKGETRLFGGKAIRKSDARVEAYGTIDELIAAIGLMYELLKTSERERYGQKLLQTMNRLFVAGSTIASPDRLPNNMDLIDQQDVEAVEAWIDEQEKTLPPLTQFVLPVGSHEVAQVHIARAVARRCERRVVAFLDAHPEEGQSQEMSAILMYLNRLSDALFVFARSVQANSAQEKDVPVSFRRES